MTETFTYKLGAIKRNEEKERATLYLQGRMDLGAYKGNETTIWKWDLSQLPKLEAAQGVEALVEVSPSTKNPQYSPSLVKVVAKETGEVLFERSSQGGGGNRSGGGGKGGGNWESPQERLFKNLSIEAQGASGRLFELAPHFIVRDTDSNPVGFAAAEFADAARAIIERIPDVAAGVRSTAERTTGGRPGEALKSGPATPAPSSKPVAPPSSPAERPDPGPSSGQAPGEPGSANGIGELRNQVLQKHGTVGDAQTAAASLGLPEKAFPAYSEDELRKILAGA